MTELHQAAIALEGLFDSDQSSSRKLLEDILENTKINNAIQAEGLKNSSLEQKNEK